ncbi:MAG: EF2563 family selenium-dependent molybdenum hydroxylase system protein [Treponema sp.]|jgi:xanthine dehydrogenase accessory factor|nr:EF2563 family selenium-dependent molybdenum hydroxylase system protein [Treponema sp.]
MFVIIKGAGDLASGIALRLHHAGFDIAMTEIEKPLSVRRTVCFSEAVYRGSAGVEDVTAVLVKDEKEMHAAIEKKSIALFIDPAADIVRRFKPAAVVDAIMAKENLGTAINDAPVVIGVGPGFTAGLDCHAVIETKRGHTIGRVIKTGSAIPNTGIPGDIGGYTIERLLRAGADGIFEARAEIGDLIKKGAIVAVVKHTGGAGAVEEIPVYAGIDGILRGLLPSGIAVTKGLKAGDIDPRCEKFHCFTVSDKALSVAGGVLEAVLNLSNEKAD